MRWTGYGQKEDSWIAEEDTVINGFSKSNPIQSRTLNQRKIWHCWEII